MRKILCALIALILAAVLSGCGEGNVSAKPQTASGNSVSSVLQQQMDGNGSEQINETLPSAGETEVPSEVDVDLKKMSGTMVYSEVFNMMSSPEDFIGKTVRMIGQFERYPAVDGNGEPVPDQYYFACVIADAAACCKQGLEFVLEGDAKYPDDYPSRGAIITVVGEFQTYMEGDSRYCHLVNAHFE